MCVACARAWLLLAEEGADGAPDLVALAAWPGVDEARVLVAPHEARATWRSFMTSSNSIIQQVRARAPCTPVVRFMLSFSSFRPAGFGLEFTPSGLATPPLRFF